jgi:BirA family biotin operon repressor/biotin-[acetyl-CoA-carboxylase] ligase
LFAHPIHTWGKNQGLTPYLSSIIGLGVVDSTNKYANALLGTKLADETAIVADFQTAGRGQFQNVWWSPVGENLLFSVVWLKSKCTVEQQFNLSVAVSVAVKRWLNKQFNLEAKIKWPNDIYIGDKKLAGILIENSIQGKEIKSSVIGIGINVNTPEFPAELARAISLRQANGGEFLNREVCLLEFLSILHAVYLQLQAGILMPLWKEYLESLYQKDVLSAYEWNGQRINGIIRGVSQEGLLQFDYENEIHSVNLKEIKYCG